MNGFRRGWVRKIGTLRADLRGIGGILFILVGCCFAAGSVRADPLDLLYNWTDPGLAGWTHSSAETSLSNPGGALELKFFQQSAPALVSDICWTLLPANAVVTNLSFRFLAATIEPSEVRLYLYSSRSGRMWFVPLANPVAGVWTEYRMPVSFTAGWITGRASTSATFYEDVRFIDWVGVYVRRHSSPAAQFCRVDDFRIQGYTSDLPDTDGDGMPDDWELLHGLNPTDPADGALDADGDGMSNYSEYRAGTDPTRPDSLLVVEIESSREELSGGGIVLKWSSVEGKTYSVWRTSDLRSVPFLRIASGLPGTAPRNQYQDTTATGEGSWFYKVGVE